MLAEISKQSAIAGIRPLLRMRAALAAEIAIAFTLTLSTAARATTIPVNSLADPGRSGICALRDAITAANTRKVTHGCKAGSGNDLIEFSVTGTVTLNSTLPTVTDHLLTIDAPYPTRITISGDNNVQVMRVAAGARLNLQRLTVSEGFNVCCTGTEKGGGIDNDGTLTLYNTAFTGNMAGAYGGAIYNGGTLSVTNSTFIANGNMYGAGIFNAGKLTVTNSGFQNNASGESGAGLCNNGPGLGDGIAGTGTAIVSKSVFSSNTANCGDGCGAGGGIANGGTLSVTQSTFSGNSTNGGGGGIENAGGTLTITNSTFSGNGAAGSVGGSGGGIENGGTLNVSNSTFSGNSAQSAGEGVGDGGGIENGGTLSITNSTFYGNGTDGEGGGIDNWGTLRVTFGTFANNGSGSPPVAGGGNIINERNASAIIKSTILAAGIIGGNCFEIGTITDAGYNISDDTTCGFAKTGSANNGDGVDPLLSTAGLANNGGPAQTVALVSGSPAIDVIPVADCTTLTGVAITTDQRGFPRPGAGETMCSIGAYEYQD
jgi:hypothetical protein